MLTFQQPEKITDTHGLPATVALLDGSNFWSLMMSLGTPADFRKLRNYIASGTSLLEANYYTAVYPTSPVEAILFEAEQRGWQPVTKLIRESQRHSKGDIDELIAADLVGYVAFGHPTRSRIDKITLISGDGDYVPIIEKYVKPHGVRLHVIGSREPGVNGRTSERLHRIADEFTEVVDILPDIELLR